jgi:8-oxo-dGTP pyrophosphatase MutT (NUDIX family)
MLTRISSSETAPASYHASIFLLPVSSGWQSEALQLLSQQLTVDINLVVFTPQMASVEEKLWELKQLDFADIIILWLADSLITPIEFSHHAQSGKLFYGRSGAVEPLDLLYRDLTGRQAQSQLTALIAEVVSYLHQQVKGKPRIQGERQVPLMIWSTPQFQNWYCQHRQIGNQLLEAKLLWVFCVPAVNFTFAYALHVKVWIAAEQRVKSNEFILSRPDISAVVAYWRHPTDWLASEIILIKEFRAPACRADGFVYELPSGSSFKLHEPLPIAVKELYEETGLQIAMERFRYIDSKQLAATWSTHKATLYAIELNAAEIERARQLALTQSTFGKAQMTELTYLKVCQLREVGKYVDWSMEGMIYRVILTDQAG